MHIIKVTKRAETEDYRSECSEGDFVSNAYGTAEVAKEVGLRHKEDKDSDPDKGRGR